MALLALMVSSPYVRGLRRRELDGRRPVDGDDLIRTPVTMVMITIVAAYLVK